MSSALLGPRQSPRDLHAVLSPKVQQDTPPHSVEAEQGVLSSILQWPRETIVECVGKITVDHFYVPAHRTTYQAFLDQWDAGEPIELITFTQILRDKNLLDSVGGPSFVTHLQTFVPTAAAIGYYIEIIQEKYARREAIAACADATKRLQKDQDDDLLSLDALLLKAESIRSVHGRNGKFTMRSPNEILALPRDQSANYCGDRVLAKGQSLLIAGMGDLGKSRLHLQQIAALTTGRPWCGLETHARGIKCVIFQAENINHRLQDDLEALKRWAGKDWKLIDQNIKIHTLETDEDFIVSLSDPAKAREMERIVHYEKPGIVSFDAVYNFGIGDLNTDQDMLATYRAMTKVARAGNPDCALTMLHHALTGREGMKKAYGFEKSSFARNSKVIFQLARAQINIVPGNEDYSVLLLFCGKNNNGKKFDDAAVRLNPETMIYEPEPDFDFEGWKEQISSNRSKTGGAATSKQAWRDALGNREYELKQLVPIVAETFVVQQRQAYNLIREAKGKTLRYNKTIKTYALA